MILFPKRNDKLHHLSIWHEFPNSIWSHDDKFILLLKFDFSDFWITNYSNISYNFISKRSTHSKSRNVNVFEPYSMRSYLKSCWRVNHSLYSSTRVHNSDPFTFNIRFMVLWERNHSPMLSSFFFCKTWILGCLRS